MYEKDKVKSENIPWTHKQLLKYLDLKGRNTISFHLNTVKENKELKRSIDELRRIVN